MKHYPMGMQPDPLPMEAKLSLTKQDLADILVSLTQQNTSPPSLLRMGRNHAPNFPSLTSAGH